MWDSSAPVGPFLVTSDELPGGVRPVLEVKLTVDGETMQNDNTGDLLFGPVALVEYVSTIVRLNPGDIIATGTPGGVDHTRDPKRYLTGGEKVVTEIPWMRSREVCVHAVDLASGLSFADLPAGFLTALADGIVAKRGGAACPAVVLTAPGERWELPGEGEPAAVDGPLADVVAHLAGRPHALTASGGTPVPVLPAWL